MTTKTIRTVAVTVLSLACVGVLYAQGQQGRIPQRGFGGMDMGMMRRMMGRRAEMIPRLDRDGDGKVSKDEFPGPDNAFARMDRNSDGFITSDETSFPGPGRAGLGAEALIRQIDKDDDGKISKTEYDNFFSEADQDKDGFLTREEIEAKMPGPGARQMRRGLSAHKLEAKDLSLKRMDLDEDGKVSSLEFPGSDDIFKKLDTDGNGFLSGEELKAGSERQDVMDALASLPTRPGPNDRRRGFTPRQEGQRSPITARLNSMDKDKDGKVSREEFTGTPEVFDRLDLDKDGFVTKTEAIRAEMMRRRRESQERP